MQSVGNADFPRVSANETNQSFIQIFQNQMTCTLDFIFEFFAMRNRDEIRIVNHAFEMSIVQCVYIFSLCLLCNCRRLTYTHTHPNIQISKDITFSRMLIWIRNFIESNKFSCSRQNYHFSIRFAHFRYWFWLVFLLFVSAFRHCSSFSSHSQPFLNNI